MKLTTRLGAKSHPNPGRHHTHEAEQINILDGIIRYSVIMLFGLVSFITVLMATVMVLQWNGVLQFLFGAP